MEIITNIEIREIFGATYNCHCYFSNNWGKIIEAPSEDACKEQCCITPLSSYRYDYGPLESCVDFLFTVFFVIPDRISKLELNKKTSNNTSEDCE